MFTSDFATGTLECNNNPSMCIITHVPVLPVRFNSNWSIQVSLHLCFECNFNFSAHATLNERNSVNFSFVCIILTYFVALYLLKSLHLFTIVFLMHVMEAREKRKQNDVGFNRWLKNNQSRLKSNTIKLFRSYFNTQTSLV